MRYNRYVPRELVVRTLGVRRTTRYFDCLENISTVEFLRVCIREGLTHMSSRRLSQVLGVTTVTLRRWLHEGLVKATRRGAVWYYDLVSVVEFLESSDSKSRV